jgi:hypothetical protein
MRKGMNSYGVVLIIIGCVLIFASGCVSNDKNAQASASEYGQQENQIPAVRSEVTQSVTKSPNPDDRLSSGIWDDPITQPQKELSASVSADKDSITHLITVTYNGGGGQQLIKDLQVRFIIDGGLPEVRQLGKNKGDSVSVPGSNKTDRVQVGLSIMGGKSYKIFDQNLTDKKGYR